MSQHPNSGAIDRQVTYCADRSTHAEVQKGLAHHRIVKRLLRSTYFDTPNHDLYRRGITLRERSTIRRNGKAGSTKTEAKIPTADGLLRIAGAEARAAVTDVIGGSTLSAVAVQTKTRQLMLMSGSAFAPDFVVALDLAEIEIGAVRQCRFEIEAQIFTALPWTRQVDAARVDRFERFCEQLETDFGLVRASESGYQAIMLSALQDAAIVEGPR